MNFYMKLLCNKKEFALFMGIVSIISVNIIAPLITCFEAEFHFFVWQDVLTVLPFIWLSVIVFVLLTYLPAEKMTAKIVSKEDSFNSHIVVNALCTAFFNVYYINSSRNVDWNTFNNIRTYSHVFYRWLRNFTISLFVGMCIAQPFARFIIFKIHLWNDKKAQI